MVLVGCAYGTSTAPRVSYLPDSFEHTQRAEAPTAQLARKIRRAEASAVVTRGHSSVGVAVMLTESGDGKVQRKRASAQRSKSFNNGKKKDPSQLNVAMLIKMGGFAKLYGAADMTEKDSGNVTRTAKRSKKSDFITMQNRATRLTVKKKRPPMLNMNMLIKSGFYAKMAEGALKERRKYHPGMLNMNMLIKMGGFVRGLEKDVARKPNMRRVARKLQSHAQYKRQQRQRKATREFKMRMRANHGRVYRRQQLGGRCHGPRCRD
jgi:hypothetical protein